MWKFSMDRHALQSKARDDKKRILVCLWIATILLAQNLAMTETYFFQQDSRHCGGTPKEAEMVFFKCRSLKTQAAGFADDFGGFQAVGEGILLSVNEQARAVESTKSAAKTTREKEIKWI